MPSLSISAHGDAQMKLRALSMAVQSRAGTNAGANAVKVAVQENFLEQPTNAKGFPSSGFWPGAARSVVKRVDGEDIVVAATQVGVRRRYFGTGGPITPNQYGNSTKKYFAVPNQAETYGKYASDYPKDSLKFVFAQDENGEIHAALVPRGETTVAARGDRSPTDYPLGTIMYWLFRTIDQAPNPDVLPTTEELYAAFGEGLLSYIRAKMHDKSLTFTTEDQSQNE
jgi:hypothetical protein